MPWPSGYPRNLNDQQRVERAQKAARARASADGLIKSLSKKTLTADQRNQLIQLLAAPASDDTAAEEVVA